MVLADSSRFIRNHSCKNLSFTGARFGFLIFCYISSFCNTSCLRSINLHIKIHMSDSNSTNLKIRSIFHCQEFSGAVAANLSIRIYFVNGSLHFLRNGKKNDVISSMNLKLQCPKTVWH